jgi:hypothetical protein
LAIASGANYKVIQSMLGHRSSALTLDLHSHLFGDDLDTVIDRMDAARADIFLTRRPPGGDVLAIHRPN